MRGRVVHKAKSGTLDALCGQANSELMLYAIRAHGRGFRWCKKCLRRSERSENVKGGT